RRWRAGLCHPDDATDGGDEEARAGRPTLAYDTRVVSPLWTNAPPPKGSWSNATMPVLNIGGGKSPAWMQNAQVAVSKTLPNATHKTLAGQNHMVSAN